MAYENVERPKPKVGGSARIQGRSGLHLIIAVEEPSRSIRIACSPRKYSSLASRMAEGNFNCVKCMLALGEGGEA